MTKAYHIYNPATKTGKVVHAAESALIAKQTAFPNVPHQQLEAAAL